MAQIKKVKIFIDGASRGNPGPAAIGIRILDENGSKIKEISELLFKATNNQAEYLALIKALIEAAKIGVGEVDIFSDSELLVRQFNGLYKIKDEKLQPLFRISIWLKDFFFKKVAITHIAREKNTLADNLANQALQS